MTMSPTPQQPTGIWMTLRCRDVAAQIRWLEAVGFTLIMSDAGTEDPSAIGHAELSWPGGGGVMLGPDSGGGQWPQPAGGAGCYLITSEVDAAFDAAVAAGASVLAAPAQQSYGARMANVRDPEGNLWSFGDYRPPVT